jgi:hypothetical protein
MQSHSKNARTFVFVLLAGLLLAAGAVTLPWTPERPQAAAVLDVSTEQFSRYINEWSEEEGYFDSDNFISNETSYLHVIDQLRKQVRADGVYLGVGPDQNFSYIVHTRPAIAIITDIRRQNMLLHLWYKALFEMSANRVEYMSLMVSRETPRLGATAPLDQILRAVNAAPASPRLFEKNLAAVKSVLLNQYKLKLSTQDLSKIEYVYRTFWEEGFDLRFSSIGRNNALNYPTQGEMLLETDRQGRIQSYLSSEELFQQLKRFQGENRLIPIVGDFAGPRALRNVGAFLKANGLRLSVFYTSNVEFYLFGTPSWNRFAANVRALPVTDDAIFIRSYFGNGRPHPLNVRGHRPTNVIKPMSSFLNDRISEYWDLVKP